MRSPVFNYAQGRVPGPMQVSLALVCVFAASLLLALYLHLAAGNAVLQTQLNARQALAAPAATQRAKPNPSAQPNQIDQALAAEMADAQLQLQTPWLPLLHALEQAHQPSLYWMQLAPDAKRKHLRMVVLAPKRQQGWALVDRLKKQSGLSDVKLNASESTDVNGLAMTTFQLEAGWTF